MLSWQSVPGRRWHKDFDNPLFFHAFPSHSISAMYFKPFDREVTKTDGKHFHLWRTFCREHKLQPESFPISKESLIFFINKKRGKQRFQSLRSICASFSKHPLHGKEWIEQVLCCDEVTDLLTTFKVECADMQKQKKRSREEFERKAREERKKEREHLHVVEGPTHRGRVTTSLIHLLHKQLSDARTINKPTLGFVISTAPNQIPDMPASMRRCSSSSSTLDTYTTAYDSIPIVPVKKNTFKKNASKNPRVIITLHKPPTTQDILDGPLAKITITQRGWPCKNPPTSSFAPS